MRPRSWTLLALVGLLAAGCVTPPLDDDDAATDDDDAAGDGCDLAALAEQVDDARLDATLTWLTSYDRRDPYDVQEEILDDLELQLDDAGLSVRSHDYDFQAQTWRNLVATVPADASLEPGTPHFVVGAHVDSIAEVGSPYAPGADDNASGVAAVLEAARLLATCDLATRIDFVFFTNEEIGTVGSARYAADEADEGADLIAMVAVDMVAYGDDGEDLDLATKTEMAWLAGAFADGVEQNTGTEVVLKIDDHCG
jgi:hypothetical protein